MFPLNLHGYGLITLAGVGEWGRRVTAAPGLEVGLLSLSLVVGDVVPARRLKET